MGCGHIVCVSVFGQIQGHQRLKCHAVGQGGHDPVAVGGGLRGCHNWRHKVWHDDCACKVAGCLGQNGGHHGTIAQV